MVVTITPDLTDVSMCESITGWAGGIAQMEAQSISVIEGTNSLACWIDNQLSATEYYTISTQDLSAGKHIYMWMNCSGRVDTKANGGYRIVLYTDSSNYATFYVGGNDTHGTGWLLMCCDASATPNLETGTFDPADVTRIGLAFKTLTTAQKRGQTYMHNCFWDAVRYGTGSTVTSGATDDADYEDIYADEVNDNYFGVIQKSYGSYIQTGKVTLGGTGTETCDFVIDNEIVVFPDNDKVAATFYGILPLGNTTNPTYVIVSGAVIKSAGAEKYTIDASGSNINTFTITGCTLNNAGTCTFQSGQTITNNVFIECDMIVPVAATFTGNTVSDSTSTTAALHMSLVAHNIENCIFNSDGTGHAIYITVAGTYDFTDLIFNGYATQVGTETDRMVYNNSGGAVTINVDGGTFVTYRNGASATTDVVQTAVLTLTVKDKDGDAIVGARCLIEAGDGTGAAPFEDIVTITRVTTTATVSHSTHGLKNGQMVNIRNANQPEYNGAGKIITYIDAGSYSYTVAGTPTTPATGTITSTQCFLSEVTVSGGIATESYGTAGVQTYRGVVAHSTAPNLYDNVAFSGTDASGGLSLPIQLGSDE